MTPSYVFSSSSLHKDCIKSTNVDYLTPCLTILINVRLWGAHFYEIQCHMFYWNYDSYLNLKTYYKTGPSFYMRLIGLLSLFGSLLHLWTDVDVPPGPVLSLKIGQFIFFWVMRNPFFHGVYGTEMFFKSSFVHLFNMHCPLWSGFHNNIPIMPCNF